MARTALYSPAHRVLNKQALGSGGAPPDIAPSIDWGGSGLMDPRLPYNLANSSTGAGVLGWYGSNTPKVVSAIPSATGTNTIATGQHTTSGTTLSLLSTSGTLGITVVSTGGTTVLPNYGVTIPAGSCIIDTAPAYIRSTGGASGGHFYTAFYNPLNMISRAVSITSGAGASGGTFTIAGYDIYGYPMTQNLVSTGATVTVTTTKCFKFVTSVTPKFTDGTGTYTVGHADVYGLPLAADYFSDVDIYWNNAIQAASTFTAAVKTTATASTGDVRGSFTPGSSSNGTIRLDMYVQPAIARVMQTPQSVGLFGVTQA